MSRIAALHASWWGVRRVLYEELLAKADTQRLLACASEAVVGYGLAHVLRVDETWISDTWETSSRIGEIESLSVLPEYRGSGLGSELLIRLEQHLYAIGAKDLILGALPGNTDAIRLYERRGYQPTWLYLSRFGGR
jgi:ribosomal protein S18 acetylase RimI-like enzyme